MTVMKKFSAVVVAALIAILALVGTPTPGAAQDKTAIIKTAAPVYLVADASRTPLRVLETHTTLRIRKVQGEWLAVEFDDPQFGRRAGYIEAKHVLLVQAERDDSSASTGDLGLKSPADPSPATASAAGALPSAKTAPPPSPAAASTRGAPTSPTATGTSSDTAPVKATAPPTRRASEEIAGADNPEKTVYVREYTRKDGTKVKAQMRRPPGAGRDRENKKSGKAKPPVKGERSRRAVSRLNER